MYRLSTLTKYLLFAIVVLALSSCKTTAPRLNYYQLAHAAICLDMDIEMDDYHPLYIESAKWIGTPYRYGGNSIRGVDCSGLTYAIYKKYITRSLTEARKTSAQKTAGGCPETDCRKATSCSFMTGREKERPTMWAYT